MRGEVYINGLDAWSYYGVVLDEGSEEALLLPSPLKTFTSNDMRSHHGKQVFTNNPRLKDRTVSLTFCFLWAEDYMEKYNRFVDMLQQGIVVLSTKIMGTKMTFNLVYNSCRKYTSIQYAGKLIVNFEEPNPANRLIGNPIDVFAPKIAALGGDSNNTIQAYKQLDPLIKSDAVTILFPTVIESGVVYGMNNISGDIIRFPFSRNSQATYFDKDINMHLVDINMPRIDYKNYGDSANLLIEKEATNYMRSSDFKEGSDNLLKGSAKAISLDVFSFIKSGAGMEKTTIASSIYKRPTNETGLRYNFSIYLEGDETLNITDSTEQQDNPNLDVVFYLNVSTSQTSLVRKKISEDYLRLSKSGILTTDNAYRGLIKYPGMSDRPIVATGYQLELGDTPTSYIPTDNTIVTRSADKLSYFIFGDCSVYLKTTKQSVVLDKPTGLWNIESDLNNEGIITLAIFDRILTASEKAQLTQTK